MNRPIPRRLLIHSATLKRRTGIDQYQQPEYTDTDLSYIRVEPTARQALTSEGEMSQDRAILFYDLRNSMPSGQSFGKGDAIDWNGEQYTIREYQTLYTVAGTPHHLEVALS